MAQSANVVTLKPRTLAVFDDYIRLAEDAMQSSHTGRDGFLWSDLDSRRVQHVRGGGIPAQLWAGDAPLKIPSGLIHDWVGAVFAPDVTVEQVLALVQDYDNHKNIYQPEVMESRLVGRDDNHFSIFLRLLKKKIIPAPDRRSGRRRRRPRPRRRCR